MTPIRYIREQIFGTSQAEFAGLIGSTQATVSRWEQGEFEPGGDNLKRIREAAIAAGKEWDDRWFFEVPVPAGDGAAAQ